MSTFGDDDPDYMVQEPFEEIFLDAGQIVCSDGEEDGEQPFSLPEAIDIMLQLASTVRYLHDRKIMHRDLKSQNILVRRSALLPEGNVEVKLADFGHSKAYLMASNAGALTFKQGITEYRAPELSSREYTQGASRQLAFRADLYSFGILSHEVLTGVQPFSKVEVGNALHEHIVNGGRPSLPDDCPGYLRLLIESCWQLQPVNRPSFADLSRMLRIAKLRILGLNVEGRARDGLPRSFPKDSFTMMESILAAQEQPPRKNSKVSNSTKTPANEGDDDWNSIHRGKRLEPDLHHVNSALQFTEEEDLNCVRRLMSRELPQMRESYPASLSAYVFVLQSLRACLTPSDLKRGFRSKTLQGIEMPDSATISQYDALMRRLLKDQIKIALEPVVEPLTAALLLQGREDRKQRQKLIAKAEQKLSLQKAKVQRLKRRRACRFQPSRRAFATKLSGTKSAHNPGA